MYVAEDDVLRQIVGFDLHRGAVASGRSLAASARVARCSAARGASPWSRSSNDYENLGVLFRNAAAFGIDAVLLDPETADPLYRRCVRVSIGHVLTRPVDPRRVARRGAQPRLQPARAHPGRRRGAARRDRLARAACA